MSQPESPPATEADELVARYGRSPGGSRRTRWVVVASAAGLVVAFVAWLLWSGTVGGPTQFTAEDAGHTVVSDSEVSVTWNLTVEPGTPMACAVQALNSTFAIVGWVVVEVPASSERIRSLTTTVRTTELAVTGLIYRCWLT